MKSFTFAATLFATAFAANNVVPMDGAVLSDDGKVVLRQKLTTSWDLTDTNLEALVT